jgi:hypothetical protein
MKTILASSALVAALLFAAAPGAVAQQSGAFCLKGSDSGGDNCSFATEAQCKAAMKGTSTESCAPNTNRTTGSGAGAAPKGAAGKGNGTAGAAASGGLQQGGSSGGATSGPNANPK